ncbi:nuclear polyadenylated RNA-binding protein 3-like [Morus notabilis]|uniref:nuclear polyadenylated RNA-binding protein 3-like n=1 Tax=Morus notabilis TaxID=981085 RepID=UPI000CED59A4|nr:nuclear polyadenylated RNA-binding protein 3-like [Morus notabilis]
MEDSFKVRVDKIFGSLNSSSSSSSSAPHSSSLSSLWCLTDGEIERIEWNRDKGSPEPESSSQASVFENRRDESVRKSNRDYGSELEKDPEDLDEDDENDDDDDESQGCRSSRRSGKPEDYNDEEWEVKSSIGLDCTLDYEEEEDEYDKVAIGKEKPGDRVYMRDIEDYGIDIDSGGELPISFKEVIRDPRANHVAAKIRLKEDAEAAKKIDSLQVSDEDTSLSTMNTETTVSEDGPSNPKSILKRKDSQLDPRSHKRVRFDPECKDNGDTEPDHKALKESSLGEGVDVENHASGIPDYLRNPSRYTCYTFDSSSDMDEESNKQAYMDFLKVLNKSNASVELLSKNEDALFDPPRSVTFIPRKKGGDTSAMVDRCTELVQQVGIGKDIGVHIGRPIGIEVADADESDACAMEEDELETVEFKKSV